jgi:hypothetical protein
MIPSRAWITAALVLIYSCNATKKISRSDSETSGLLRSHIQYLADDRLEGRRTGTNGEKLAMEYISRQFKEIGLLPKGTDSYYQPFEVNDGKQINAATQLSINSNKLETGKNFFPFAFSPNQTIEAVPAISVREADMPWFVDLKEVLEENRNNPHFDVMEYVRTSTKKLKDKGASAIIIYNSSTIDDKLEFDPKDRSPLSAIPVLYINKETAQKYFKDPAATLNIKFRVDISEKMKTGHNVIGYIDNGAPGTVILGAHFDHLGYGEDGNSMLRTGEKLIHNGADDNASGTAVLIELARKLKRSKATHNNYLFIAFSGEELGLFGSKYFTEHPTFDIGKASYMINMDMVGRLNDSSKTLTIGGVGTSPEWGTVINEVSGKRTRSSSIVIRVDSSGTGPSDHTSFYRKDIPVLFYFTGLHSDYHKPTDDANKINYGGTQMVLEHILGIVEALDNKGKLAFTKTRETQTGTSTRFSVSLGIMPDYTYAGVGVRADGISEGKAAQKAGLKAGDVITQLGEHTITSLESYMQALSKFKKGDKTKVKYKRGNETLESSVEF